MKFIRLCFYGKHNCNECKNEIVSGTKTGLFLSVTTICVLYYYLNSDEKDREPGFNFSPDYHPSNSIEKTTQHILSGDQHYICPVFDGGIGNQMFQFASSYGIARSKNIKVLISEFCKLMTMFDLNVTIVKDISVCKKFRILREIQNSVYDKRMTSFDPSTNVRLTIYLQSYRYFDTFKSELRKQLTFRHEIKTKANLILDKNLRRLSITCHAKNEHLVDSIKNSKYSQCYSVSKEKVTLIGIHVRRGDWLRSPHPKLGFQTASKEYLHRAVEWYQKRFKNIIFILATNGMNWTRENLPQNITVIYLEENSPPVDMAVLASCEHFLSTVGTFGWWTGWLAGGNVTYFKWPAREKTQFRRAFGKDFSDHFYPSWIGL